MGKLCDPLTSSLVTVLTISVAAPGQLRSALTAHHIASNLPHILQEKDADVGVVEKECEKQLISNTVGVQRHATKCRGTNVRLGIEASLVSSNYRSNTMSAIFLVRRVSGKTGRVKRKGNEVPHKLEENERERNCMNREEQFARLT